MILLLMVVLFLSTTNILLEAQEIKTDDTTHRLSKQGVYFGYSNPIYAESYNLSSTYVEMRDGTKLAMDIYRPKDLVTGKVVEKPLPVVWMHTPYNRRYNDGSTTQRTIECYAGTASRLVQFGYVVATVDFRGLYASFGHNQAYNRGEWISSARYDAYDVTEWLAKQSWSTGNIGMWGCSATGGSQIQAATTAPPHLKAIFPMSFEFDVYDFRVPGGIAFAKDERQKTVGQLLPYEKRDAMAAPVDNDTNNTMLKKACSEHIETIESAGFLPFRDSRSKQLRDTASSQWWLRSSPSGYLKEINESGIAMYMAANWDEGATKPGPFFAFNNFKTPSKLIVGPGLHCDWFTSLRETGFDIVIEELRFFDYWLKGIDNGIQKEDPIYYFTYNAAAGEEWRSAKSWPLPEEKRIAYYLSEGMLSTSTSNDFEPSVAKSTDALIFETQPLEDDVQLTGHPSIHLWMTTSASDVDVIATIKDVSPDGVLSSYNIQGQLRASLRKRSEPPYNNLGLPYHGFNESDVMPLTPGEPFELDFSILPISILFKAGHKIQLSIRFGHPGDQVSNDDQTITIHHDASHPSHLQLPMVENWDLTSHH